MLSEVRDFTSPNQLLFLLKDSAYQALEVNIQLYYDIVEDRERREKDRQLERGEKKFNNPREEEAPTNEPNEATAVFSPQSGGRQTLPLM